MAERTAARYCPRCGHAIPAVFMVVEVTGSYSVILPVMISNMIACLISRHYQRVPLFDLLSHQDGMALPSIEAIREQPILRVEEAMRPGDEITLRADDSLAAALRQVSGAKDSAFLVRHPDGAWMAVEKEEIANHTTGSELPRVRDVPSRGPLPFLYRDQSLEEAMRLIGDWPIVPVLNRADLDYLEGVLTMADILHTYRKAASTPE